MEGLSRPLGLALVALKALMRWQAAALSGLGLAFLIRCGVGHDVCLHIVGGHMEDVETTMT